MFKLILPEQPVLLGNSFQVKLVWEEPQELESLKLSLGWAFHCDGGSTAHTLAREEYQWPGRAGEMAVSWRLPAAPYSFDASGIAPGTGLSYLVEVEARPGRIKLVETLPTLVPGHPHPIELYRVAVPATLELPWFLKFILNHS